MALYLMGDEARDFQSAESHRNVIFERYKFNPRVQSRGESVETFLTSLSDQKALKEELICDRIVIGIAGVKVSKRLQLWDKLAFSEAISTAHKTESQTQTKFIH